MKPTDIKKKKYSVQNPDWNKSYNFGIEQIDQQHAIFFKLFKELKALNQEPYPFNKLKELIGELEKYTNVHFRTEETLLAQSNSLDLDTHITQHQIFRNKIEEFKIAETYKNTVLIDQMIGFMRKWFLMHIAEMDRKYIEDVKNVLNANSPEKTFN